jgi:hypothetical protein
MWSSGGASAAVSTRSGMCLNAERARERGAG